MKVIIVSGSPASGKTTLAIKIAKDLNYQIVTKDFFKEKLFESDGRSNVIHNSWYEKTSKKQFREMISTMLENKENIVIESNFEPKKDTKSMRELLKGQNVIEVHCTANQWKTFSRFVKRNESGKSTKHPMHHDRMFYPSMLGISITESIGFSEFYGALNISSKKIRVNTDDFSSVDTEKILTDIKSFIDD